MAKPGEFNKEELQSTILSFLSLIVGAYGVTTFNQNELNGLASFIAVLLILAYKYYSRKL